MSDTPEVRDPERLDLPSASAFEILAECWGQAQLKKRLPPEAYAIEAQAKDEITDRGTRIHAARETGNTLELSEEEDALYQAGLRYEQKLVEKWKWTFNLTDVQEGPRELRLWLLDANLNRLASGKLDVHFISGTHGAIIDWKTGFLNNLVGAPGNWQLRLQAVLLWLEHDYLTDIRVAFAKPLFEGSEPDFCDYTAQDLKYSYDSILYLLWWSTQPDAPRRAGLHCRYCPCKAWCPEAAAFALLPSVIACMAAPDSVKVPEMVGKMLPEDLLKCWDMDTVVRKILDGIDARLKTFSKEELFRLGLELPEKGKARDTIVKVRDAMAFLIDAHGFKEDDLWDVLQLGKGKVSQIAQREKSLAKKWADKWTTETLQPFIERTYDQPALKRIKGL